MPPSVLALLLTVSPSPAHAQLYESVGIRAQGMGGAFVALADDATATWWNPAGLATGPLFSGIVEPSRGGAADGGRVLGIAFAVPSLGLSYYRLKISELRPLSGSIEPLNRDRQDPGVAGPGLPAYVLGQVGVTVGQSLGDHLVVGSTVMLVRADQRSGSVAEAASIRWETCGPRRAREPAPSSSPGSPSTPRSPGARIRRHETGDSLSE